jgi:hypothetical protein
MTKLTPPSLRTLIKKPGRHSDGNGLFFRTLGVAKAYWVYRFRVGRREREMRAWGHGPNWASAMRAGGTRNSGRRC